MTRSIDAMIDFFLREKGEPIQLNGVPQLALLTDATDKIYDADEKLIRAATPLFTGDNIDYRNERYVIISQIDHNEYSYRGRMRKCNYRIAFNWNGNVKCFDAIVEGKAFAIDTGTIISMPNGNIFAYLQDSADTKDISLNQRFYNTHQPFRVEGIDRTTNGIVKLSCTLDTISSAYDDVENNIADRWKYEISHTYSLNIDNGTNANVLMNDTLQINCTATDNGNPMENPAITYTSSDSNVISVDNQGNVMGIQIGQATITAKLTYRPSVEATIIITAVETLTHNYSISITGTPTITIGQSASYVSHVYDNGAEVLDQSVQWSLRNQDNSTPVMGSITTSTGNSVTVKAGTHLGKSLILSAALSSDPTIINEKTIQIASLF
jgi:hypothetical protein